MGAVARQGKVINVAKRDDGFNQRFHIPAEQRFAAGDPHLVDAKRGGHPDHTGDFFIRQNLRARFPRVTELGFLFGRRFVSPLLAIKVGRLLGLGEAVGTAEIAAVSDADPQVSDDSFVSVLKYPGRRHGVTPSGGVLVEVGAILTVPSRRISTFKSALVVGSSFGFLRLMLMSLEPPFWRAPP